MLQNARATAFTVSELLKENQQEGKTTPTPFRLGLKRKVYSLQKHISIQRQNQK